MFGDHSLPNEPEGFVARGDDFVGGAACASIEAELSAFVDWLIDHAEEVVLVLLVVLAVVFEGLDCVSLCGRLVLDDSLLLDGLKRWRRVEFLCFLSVLDEISRGSTTEVSRALVLQFLRLLRLIDNLLLPKPLHFDPLQFLRSDRRA